MRPAHVAVLLLVIVANGQDVVAQSRGGGKLPPQLVEIEAHAVFRNAFIEVMAREGHDWQLQPARPRGPVPSGRPPLAHEEMHWGRDDGSYVRVRYSRYTSTDEAEVALAWQRELISVATFVVKGLADEAYVPSNGGALLFRRGAFVFRVSYRPSGLPTPLEPVKAPTLCPHSKADCAVISNGEPVVLLNGDLGRISALFLAAVDSVLDGGIAR